MPKHINRLMHWNVSLLMLLILMGSCTKFVQIDPPSTAIASSTVYENNTSAAAVMTSVYYNMTVNYVGLAGGSSSLGYLTGLASDELKNYDPTNELNAQFYSNALSSSSGSTSNYYFWTELYSELHVCNAILEGIEKSSGLSASVKNQIIGEAKFMRAFLDFYATNLYGDIPLVNTTNYLINNTIHKTHSEQVYQQIIADLKDAESKLGDKFLDASGNISPERVRPNKGAASALLARVYLYTGVYDSAEMEATQVISNETNYSLDSSLDQVFLKNNPEAILQLQSIIPGQETYDGLVFPLTSSPGTNGLSVAMSTNLVNAFETGDMRYSHWVGAYTSDSLTYYYYPYKYKIGYVDPSREITEYTMVLRLAEQYLIRAESRAHQGNISSAQADLDVIRKRAGLSNTTAGDQASLLVAILHERQLELFTEWGHRWFDLKRTDSINTVMSVVTPKKGGVWSPNWALLPIPLAEIKANPNLIQNPGYN